jgi:hypothetical protein
MGLSAKNRARPFTRPNTPQLRRWDQSWASAAAPDSLTRCTPDTSRTTSSKPALSNWSYWVSTAAVEDASSVPAISTMHRSPSGVRVTLSQAGPAASRWTGPRTPFEGLGVHRKLEGDSVVAE